MRSATKGTDGLDEARLRSAVHELGHAVAMKAADVQVVSIWVRGSGSNTGGGVETAMDLDTMPEEQIERWMVAIMAGREAEWLWCDQNRIERRRFYRGAVDLGIWRQERHRAPKLTEARAVARAQKLVLSKWDRIVHLAPELARDGRVRV